jgi:hypothetical protein
MGRDEAVAGTEPPKLGFRFAMHLCATVYASACRGSHRRRKEFQSKYPRAFLTPTAPQI